MRLLIGTVVRVSGASDSAFVIAMRSTRMWRTFTPIPALSLFDGVLGGKELNIELKITMTTTIECGI